MNKIILIAAFSCTTIIGLGQPVNCLADSIRIIYKIPELAYAVVSADSVYELSVTGLQRINTSYAANLNDKFRIGSNTKAITAFIAATIVKEGKIQWDTKFFDLFPELKETSNKAYYKLTLLDLLSFRTKLVAYTYTWSIPTKEQFKGNEAEQRYQFAKWAFQQKPVTGKADIHFSNIGYVAAGLMLEKITGTSYRELVEKLGDAIHTHFGFGAANITDSLQPWGHNEILQLDDAANNNNYKLEWLLAAGNINVNLPDYIRFIQLQLAGLRGYSSLLTKSEFEFLHFGLPQFAVGWFWAKDEHGQKYSYNIGNPGSFLSAVYIHPDNDKAFIFFCNAQTKEAETGLSILYQELKKKYNL